MDRLQAFLDALIKQHSELLKKGVDKNKEQFILGKITGVRTAIMLINNPDTIIPSDIIH